MKKALKNIGHTFDVEKNEIGVTIRKGTKWAEQSAVGESIELWNCEKNHVGLCEEMGCEYCGSGVIVGWHVCHLKYLPVSLLKLEHNKEARNMKVLKEMLETGYGSISDSNTVTALIYLRTE